MDLLKIGPFLAELRHEKNWTQEQLATQLGISYKTVSRWETGTYLPPIEMLQQLCAIYAVSIDEILSGKRLPDAAWQEKAEENPNPTVQTDLFSTQEQIRYSCAKWRKEHCAEKLLGIALVAVLFLLGLRFSKWLSVIASILIPVLLATEHNRMMTYAERHVFEKH